jgi:hypothetical protein
MSPGHDTDTGHHTDRFDAAAREAHAVALERLSPQVRAQLAQRRRAALAGPRPARVRSWGLMAVGSAALLALAVGIFLQREVDGTQVAPTDGGLAALPATTTPGTDITTPAPAPDSTAPAIANPVVADTDAPAADASPLATGATPDPIEVDALPDTWLAAEFDDAEAEAAFAGFEETPDFYLWLGSDEDLAGLTEVL